MEVVSGRDPGHSRVAKRLDGNCVNRETGAQGTGVVSKVLSKPEAAKFPDSVGPVSLSV